MWACIYSLVLYFVTLQCTYMYMHACACTYHASMHMCTYIHTCTPINSAWVSVTMSGYGIITMQCTLTASAHPVHVWTCMNRWIGTYVIIHACRVRHVCMHVWSHAHCTYVRTYVACASCACGGWLVWSHKISFIKRGGQYDTVCIATALACIFSPRTCT